MKHRLARLALLCAAVMFIPIRSNTAVPVSPDASWWANLSTAEQRIAVEAAISSYESGFGAGLSAAVSTMNDTSHESTSFWEEFAARTVRNAYRDGRTKYSHSADFYASAVTDFYKLHTDRSDIRIGDLITCLADNPSYTCDSLAKAHPPTP